MKVIKNTINNYSMINPLTTVNRINLYKNINKDNVNDVMIYLLLTRIINDYTNELDVVSFRQYKAKNYDLRTSINSYDYAKKIVIEYSVEYIDNLVNNDIVLDVINQIISINNINQSLFIQKRDDLITEIKSIKDNPQSEVKNLLAKTLYQDALDIEEMINVLTNIRIDDLTQALEKIINTKIFLQINYLADKKEVNDFTTTSVANKFDYQPLNQDIKDLVVDDNNMQANIMLSYKINTKLSREEKILFNALFGSGADSLLFKIIREQHHLCYSVSSMLMENDILAVYVGLDKDKIDFCIKEVNNILEQLKENDSIYNLDSIIKQVEDKLLRSRDKFSYNKQLIINHVLFGYEYDINTIINNISNMTSDKIKDIANVITPINQVIIK